MKHKSFSDFSEEFFNDNPELYDRVLVKKTVEITFEIGNHLSDEEILEYLSKSITMNRRDYELELKKC